jgi:hypothetical protein
MGAAADGDGVEQQAERGDFAIERRSDCNRIEHKQLK